MKKQYKKIFWVIMALIVVANTYLFLQGLTLGDQIGQYERSITKLRLENTDLEKKVFQSQSFTYASAMAEAMKFTKKTEPIYVDNLLYAKN